MSCILLSFFHGYSRAKLLTGCDCSGTSTPRLSNQLCAHNLARRLALEDSTDGHKTHVGLVHVLLLPHLLALVLHSLVEPVEPHVLQVVSHNLGAGNATVVVERLVHKVAILCENAVCVRVAAVIVDGVKNVVCELELVNIERIALSVGRAGAASHIVDETAGAVDDGTKTVTKFGKNWVEVNGAESIVLFWLTCCTLEGMWEDERS